MAYDEGLAHRIREVLDGNPTINEKKMFGGLSFLVNGNMACGIIGEELIVRLGKENSDSALAQPHTRAFDFTGRPMKGWVVVEVAGIEADNDLLHWVKQGLAFAHSLPAK